MSEIVIRLDRVRKSFDRITVLEDISADVCRGETIGLLGLNGAGKTTLLETILGFAVPDSGTIELFGTTASALADTSIKHRIGFVPQQDELIETMRGGAFLRLISKFYRQWNTTLIERLAREWQVPLDRPAGKLSVGERQKLTILAALGHEPELIVLDEPVASLDPVARRAFLRELVDLVASGERTILFSTHIVSDLERIASRVWMLKDRRLVLDEPLDTLKERTLGADRAAIGLPAAGASLEETFLELYR